LLFVIQQQRDRERKRCKEGEIERLLERGKQIIVVGVELSSLGAHVLVIVAFVHGMSVALLGAQEQVSL
jgi:hypothetical protein